MPSVPDPELNLRLRTKRNDLNPCKFHGVRLDIQSEATLKSLKEMYKSPTNPLDTPNISAVLRRALAIYQEYALNPQVRIAEYNNLRFGTVIPVKRNRKNLDRKRKQQQRNPLTAVSL